MKGLLLTTSVGITMVVSIIIGLIIGIYLDRYFESRPWLTIIFILLGVVAGFKNMHRTMKEHGF
ncbi:MAG: AtpZ/AtpI family protein [Deltaproteobacteria bacterium]|nr:AtpZ/AtpI family protein [Deltaproteobacteria bacterium]